jgi:hypothetical protein
MNHLCVTKSPERLGLKRVRERAVSFMEDFHVATDAGIRTSA